ncbi:hypothetical protein A2380_01000 [candidate division WWE3 bacterium RIFOXYB1_FULL_43_24]|uniref:Cps8L n=2 Tax=Katanobacteria TaxID=422282 RepID=A0A0G1BPL5_UNCKA|nr:MAG: Cps8L [candidate division WWE3 bacterium GW2011_GWA1_42_12]KKS35217.1 MAG: Cps8L [candidate division WWE3 bacterium GW2011_GWD1_42_14]KKS39433.1 MAG: Cps8L [candidate division WWE3 bacterium GW2011_GWF1_42_14]KKS40876.1 MAG: Cps8L [candidate division WWE3 bacterium GW2011_GWE1_42_16]KKS67302.1 MAG: Cps8L [candidate division WWE3 bacterium GW2011_GWB1_42_6]OGC69821.1 MAG: hypothetical protein A2380_01000 [candidate division WWE3 bacterium RIFOXYB1_FULL_43_24]OGC72551.1 MAG: hypothetica
MPAKSLKKISLVGLGNVFNAGLGFLFLAAVARTLDLETFGKYALLSTLLLTISKIVDFGANSVYVARSIKEQNSSLSNTLFTLKVIQFLVSVPISLISLKLLNIFDGTIATLFILGILAYTMNYLFYAYFQRAEKYAGMVLLNTVPQLIKGVFAFLFFAATVTPSLHLAFGIFSLSIFAGVVLYFFLPAENKKFIFDFRGVRELFKESSPAGISQIVYESWGTLNNAIAKFTKGFGDVGILSLANKISNLFSLASLSIFAVLLPKNATRKLTGKKYDYQETALIAGGIIALAVVAIAGSELFITTIFGEKFSGSVKLLDILILAAAVSAIHTFIENLFFVESKTGYIIAATVIKLSTYGLTALILVPKLSLYGIAWSNLVSAIAGLITALYFISRFKDLPHQELQPEHHISSEI